MPDRIDAARPTALAGGSEPSISETLRRLAEGDPESRISVGDMVAALDERAFGLGVFVFALPNCIPGPVIPGMSALLGLPILLLGLQMALGRDEPRLPRFLLAWNFRCGDFARILARAAPRLARFERLFRPRPGWLVSRAGERLVGVFIVLFALVLAMPIPLGNLPPAWGIVITGLGISEQDNRAVLAGLVLGALGVGWNAVLIAAGWEAITEWLPQLF